MWAVALLVLAVSLLYELPYIVVPALLGNPPGYTPLALDAGEFVWDETVGYMPQVRRVFDGVTIVHDATVFEHRADPSPIPPLPPLVFGMAARLLGGVAPVFVVAKAVIAALGFLLTFALMRSWLHDFWLAAAAGILAFLAATLMALFPPLSPHSAVVFFGELARSSQMEHGPQFSRSLTPGPPLVIWLGGVLTLALALQRGKRLLALLSGLLFGLLFYCDFYYASASALGLGLLLLFFLVRRDRLALQICALALASLAIVVLPFVANAIRVRQSPAVADFFLREDLKYTRAVTSWSYLPKELAIAAFALLAAGAGPAVALPTAMLLAGVAGLYSNVISGVRLQPTHYLNLIEPASAMLWTVVAAGLVMKAAARVRPERTRAVVGGALVLGGLVYGAWNQANYIRRYHTGFLLSAERLAAFRWIDANTPTGSVVMSATPRVNLLLPGYTHAYVYFPVANQTISPTWEIVRRLAITYRFLGIPREALARFLNDQGPPPWPNSDGAWVLTHRQYANEIGSVPAVLPEDFKLAVLREYDQSLLTPAVLRQYRLDYLWYGENERALGELPAESRALLRLLYQDGTVSIYQVVSPEQDR